MGLCVRWSLLPCFFQVHEDLFTTINGPVCSYVRLCQVSSSILFLSTLLPLITPERPQITPERSQITQECPRTAPYHPRTSPARPRTPQSVPKSPPIPKLPLISCKASQNHPKMFQISPILPHNTPSLTQNTLEHSQIIQERLQIATDLCRTSQNHPIV